MKFDDLFRQELFLGCAFVCALTQAFGSFGTLAAILIHAGLRIHYRGAP